MLDAVACLIYRAPPGARELEKLQAAQGTSATHANTTTRPAGANTQDVPLVRIRLDSVAAEGLLAAAPSANARRAYLAGELRPGAARRLQVVGEDKADESAGSNSWPRWRDTTSAGWGKLYEEGREWWVGSA